MAESSGALSLTARVLYEILHYKEAFVENIQTHLIRDYILTTKLRQISWIHSCRSVNNSDISSFYCTQYKKYSTWNTIINQSFTPNHLSSFGPLRPYLVEQDYGLIGVCELFLINSLNLNTVDPLSCGPGIMRHNFGLCNRIKMRRSQADSMHGWCVRILILTAQSTSIC